jgi:hypothetical protein
MNMNGYAQNSSKNLGDSGDDAEVGNRLFILSPISDSPIDGGLDPISDSFLNSTFVQYSSCLDEDVAKELDSVTKHAEEDSEEEYADYGEEEDNERDEF